MNSTIHQPVISVFMPVYNGEKVLRKSIQSVLNQTFEFFELVIVDDFSTDSSRSVIQDFASTDKRVRILLKNQNGGNVPKSWNYVMPFIRGKFVMYMSQDDYLPCDYMIKNYDCHKITGAEVIVPNLIYDHGLYPSTEQTSRVGETNFVVSSKEAFEQSVKGKLHGFLFVISDLILEEEFEESIFNYDEFIFKKVLLKANKVAFSNACFNYFVGDVNAISRRQDEKQVERLLCDQKLIILMEEYEVAEHLIHSYERLTLSNLLRFYSSRKRLIYSVNNSELNIMNEHLEFLRDRDVRKFSAGIKGWLISILLFSKLTFILGLFLYWAVVSIKKIFS